MPPAPALTMSPADPARPDAPPGPPRLIRRIDELRQALGGAQRAVFVPTMGSLHEGHLALVRQAVALAAPEGRPVVASIFVNRLQFGPHEDFDRYPRQLERDRALLAQAGCDLLFAPDEAELYPQPQAYTVQPPAALADVLEGAFRPGFFTGVATVVMKLFQVVQPHTALFGRKDYQQLRVIQGLVEQFALPVRVQAGDTVRAADGLALSSRNAYLSPAERAEAPRLHAELQALGAGWRAGPRTPARREALEAEGLARLRAAGWQPDYLALWRQDLAGPAEGEAPAVVLAAARLGATRLIDNVEA